MFKNFPAEAVKILGSAAAFTRTEVLAAAQAVIAFAATLEQEYIKGDIKLPADFVLQVETFVENGLETHLPAWLVQLAMDILNQYLFPLPPKV